ncbi:glyoxylase-like metal-dependent hydrolase (beta-lactamase superfamily II) [Halarchaeum rubridurum]|uniref:Glyoxylase-like metal-dependent hydrolase (Beta-lactamase superfamily II) n=1 Tax=Halarchaeum rubridurum TaxID=489911 RepID=A0A830FWQ9_9EURY|nr:MBL fold metallo-hydrolase [Halarchaeum rubridurum]MBP1953680.1 glyoxylase-like metal-dependent hydrolase (beta-lactamase superfamily II) [Halarchaeum rubridurum]GGM53835.1 MBL fold hydrolase [Halarchaeum rubridurum]
MDNTVFEGRNDVYLLDEGSETALVDVGDPTASTREDLRAALAAHDLSFADVDTVLLTHWHPDHIGLAGVVQAAGGATVHVHEADAPLVAGDEAAWDAMRATQHRRFEEWGIPDAKRDELRANFHGPEAFEAFADVTPFSDGATFDIGTDTLRAVHVSGHAAGLCLFEFDDDGAHAAFTGDALLPEYTPNVGGADVRVEHPLRDYVAGLERVAAADYDVAWPGHRDRIDDPTGRAREIITHHEHRAWRVLDAVRRLDEPDTWAVSADLFGDLHGVHILHGPGEADAHLRHLAEAGVVHRDADRRYRLADGIAARLAGRSDERWPLTEGADGERR